MTTVNINGNDHDIEADPDTPLLWVLRDHLGLTGTKFGCGIGACGACTVHLNGTALRACVMPLAACAGQTITTIEGLSANGQGHALQQAWITHQVPQCGYCQSGMIMAAAALLAANPRPDDEQIGSAITNICRCGTYPRVRQAIKNAAAAID